MLTLEKEIVVTYIGCKLQQVYNFLILFSRYKAQTQTQGFDFGWFVFNVNFPFQL